MEDDDLKKVMIKMELVDKLNQILADAEISVADGLGALLWLAALAAQQSGLDREQYFAAAGDLYDQIEAEEKRQAGSLN